MNEPIDISDEQLEQVTGGTITSPQTQSEVLRNSVEQQMDWILEEAQRYGKKGDAVVLKSSQPLAQFINDLQSTELFSNAENKDFTRMLRDGVTLNELKYFRESLNVPDKATNEGRK